MQQLTGYGKRSRRTIAKAGIHVKGGAQILICKHTGLSRVTMNTTSSTKRKEEQPTTRTPRTQKITENAAIRSAEKYRTKNKTPKLASGTQHRQLRRILQATRKTVAEQTRQQLQSETEGAFGTPNTENNQTHATTESMPVTETSTTRAVQSTCRRHTQTQY